MSQFIAKKDLFAWLDKVRASHDLVAPVKVDDLLLFQRVGRVEDIVLDYQNTNMSPKEFFFPSSEVLFAVEKKDGQTSLTPTKVEKETVIFGMRPCDARGMASLGLPFLEEPGDALFRQHRDKTTIVGLSCLTACAECFCTSMGSAPDDSSNVDVMLTGAKDGYIVQVLTEKGKALTAGAAIADKAVEKPAAPAVAKVPSEGVAGKIRAAFDDPYWGRVADRCIHCNICSYVCPTCYCFDIRDYNGGGKIERVRSWESCQSPGFTKLAGGHDPRGN